MPDASPPRLRAPIVLAHGLLGFARIAVRGRSVAAYFRGIPELLAGSGNPVVVPEVPPTASIAARAEALRRGIEALVGEEPVHIIAHSMGGLDARHMITHLGMAGRVLSLTTVGTPHRGTPFADWGVGLAERSGLLGWLRRFPVDLEAFGDLRTDACARFNERTPDAPGVLYLSVAGEKRREEMLYALRFAHDVIAPREGPNDGLVSVASARWGEGVEVWECDHFNLVGWAGPRERVRGFFRDARPLYAGLLRSLASRGF